jgi:hypothetical protein
MEVQVQIQGSPYIRDCYCDRLISSHLGFSLSFIVSPLVLTPLPLGACTVVPSEDSIPRDLGYYHTAAVTERW